MAFPISKILVIQTAFIGDAILATAVLEKLRLHHPQAEIDFCLRQGNEPLFDGHPFINQLFIWEKKQQKYKNLVKLSKEFRKRKYDLVINLQRYFASGFLTAFSGAKITTGFDKNPWSKLFSFKFPHDIGKINDENYLHEVERNQQLISKFTDDVAAKPKLYPQPKHIEKARNLSTEKFITISPASIWFTKQYPLKKWIEFMNLIPPDLQVYILGSAVDAKLGEQIIWQSQHKKSLNLCGEMKLLETAALMQYSSMNYVNDSAPLHLASATNAPVTAVFCSTIPQFGFGPLSDKSFVVQKNEPLYCRPCGLHGYKQCPEKHFKCAFDIDNQQLVNKLNL